MIQPEMEPREADIDAVEVGNEIADHYEGHDTSEDLRVSAILDD